MFGESSRGGVVYFRETGIFVFTIMLFKFVLIESSGSLQSIRNSVQLCSFGSSNKIGDDSFRSRIWFKKCVLDKLEKSISLLSAAVAR